MRIFPFKPIESTCTRWRNVRWLVENSIPKPLEFCWENDKRIAVGTNTRDIDELWRIAPSHCVNDMRGRIYTMAQYLHHAIDLDSMRMQFLDRPGSETTLEAMNKALRKKDFERYRLGLALFDELIQHSMGICETVKPLHVVLHK